MNIEEQKLKELENAIDTTQKDYILKSRVEIIIDNKIAEIIIHEPNTIYERGKINVLQEIKEKLLKEGLNGRYK